MNNSKENDEVGKEVPPAPNPVEEGTLSEVQVEAPVDQSSLPVPMEESSDPVENGHGIAVVKNSTDDNKPKTAPGPPLPEQHDSTSMEVLENQEVIKPEHEEPANAAETQDKDADSSQQETTVDSTILSASQLGPAKPVLEAKAEDSGMRESKIGGVAEGVGPDQNDAVIASDAASVEVKDENEKVEHTKVEVHQTETPVQNDAVIAPDVASVEVKDENEKVEQMKIEVHQTETPVVKDNGNSSLKHLFLLDENDEGSESGTEEEQSLFMKELENFFRERSMEFKPPKFYGEGLNCLKLWRAVTRLGGYDKVTSCKLWRQVGESFKPPKTCTTVSWTFRGFYEKALLDYERHKIRGGELNIPAASPTEPIAADNQASGSGRAPRDAAARARQGWHSQRLLGNGEVSDPIIKDKNAMSLQKREKQLKNIGLLKRKKQPYPESSLKVARPKTSKSQLDVEVVDIGPPAEWVKINVQKTKDCFEVYALVPGLLREEVRVQSDPAGRLVISGEPENPDNPWGVTPFKKVVNLPSRIDPHQTSAVVTLHGQLFVRVPFEQSE